MWGIFIAKYSPNFVETLFGNGPNQLNNYLYSQEVRLDLPEEKLKSLYLPHSSIIGPLYLHRINWSWNDVIFSNTVVNKKI